MAADGESLPRMPAVSLSEAALALGFKSRSTLFRLRDAGELADYLRPPAGTGGAQRLEMDNEERRERAAIDVRWGGGWPAP